MFGSEVLDVALGLVLVFLLMSLVLTAVQEALEAWFRSRAGDLHRAVFELLQNDRALVRKLYDHPLVFALHRARIASDAGGEDEGAAEDGGTASPYVRPSRAERALLPSYIPRETFAAALIDLLGTGQARDRRLVASFDALNRLSGGDLGRVRAEIEGWYDGAMDRASGWFKRRTQKTLFLLGLASALLLNVNAVVIARHLATDQQARAFAAEYARGITQSGQPTPDQVRQFQTELQDKVGLPIGWSDASVAKLRESYPAAPASDLFQAIIAGLVITAGYLVTAFAAMLGAPFWFDVLNRIMVIRSTVKPREKSQDEPSEDKGGGRQARPAAEGEASGRAAPPPAVAGATGVAGPALAGVGAGAMAGAAADEEEDLDGCIAEHDIAAEEATCDIDLPPATGGVATA